MKCAKCKINYPKELVSAMASFVNGRMHYQNLCGICALAASNRIHGIHRRRFTGMMAEQMRQEAIKFRKEHNLGTL